MNSNEKGALRHSTNKAHNFVDGIPSTQWSIERKTKKKLKCN